MSTSALAPGVPAEEVLEVRLRAEQVRVLPAVAAHDRLDVQRDGVPPSNIRNASPGAIASSPLLRVST